MTTNIMNSYVNTNLFLSLSLKKATFKSGIIMIRLSDQVSVLIKLQYKDSTNSFESQFPSSANGTNHGASGSELDTFRGHTTYRQWLARVEQSSPFLEPTDEPK